VREREGERGLGDGPATAMKFMRRVNDGCWPGKLRGCWENIEENGARGGQPGKDKTIA